MSLLLNAEQTLLRDTAMAMLADRSPVSLLRELRARENGPGHEPALWDEVAALGWVPCWWPEQHGGLEMGFKGVGALFEAMGRHLSNLPLLSASVLGPSLLMEAQTEGERHAAWLEDISEGRMIVALAFEEQDRHDAGNALTRLLAAGAGASTSANAQGLLNGRKRFVLDGAAATHLIVSAMSDNGPTLVLVDVHAAGVSRQVRRTIDGRRVADFEFHNVAVEVGALLAVGERARAALDQALDRAAAVLAAESLGVAEEAFERTRQYLQQRVQFGVPIGSFQALQHRAARLKVELELARSAVAAALAAFDDPGLAPSQRALRASLAKALTADTTERVLNEAVQMHGGIGVTDELDIGLFLKRGRVIQMAFGDARHHRQRWAKLKGLA